MSGFSSEQLRILAAFADALLPADEGVAPHVTAELLALRVEEFLSRLGGISLVGLGLLLWVFDLSVPLVLARFKRFVNLDRDERVRYVRAWDESRLYLRRSALLALKTVVTMVYGSIPEVQLAIGYAPGNIVQGTVALASAARAEPVS